MFERLKRLPTLGPFAVLRWGILLIGFFVAHGKLLPMTRRFDIRKIRKLAARERYAELYFYWREAEQMIASNFPDAQRYGRRLKKRIENLHADWFGAVGGVNYVPQSASDL